MHNALKGKQEFIVLSIIGPTGPELSKLNIHRPSAASESSKSEKDLLLFSLSVWQNRKVIRSR